MTKLKLEVDGNILRVRADDGKLVQGATLDQKVTANALKSKIMSPAMFSGVLSTLKRKMMDYPGVTEKDANKIINEIKAILVD